MNTFYSFHHKYVISAFFYVQYYLFIQHLHMIQLCQTEYQ